MNQCVVNHDDSIARERFSSRSRLKGIAGGLAAALVAFAYVCAPYVDLAAIRHDAGPATPSVELTNPVPARGLYLDAELFDRTRPLGFAPRAFGQMPPLSSAFVARTPRQTDVASAAPSPMVRTVASVPLPTPRPVALGLTQDNALQAMAPRNRFVRNDDPFEKLFGKKQTSGFALAYAAVDGGLSRETRGAASNPGLGTNDGVTAIYDIKARMVYLPDGTKLEAHSGLGEKMDDPRHVNVRMHGATPPHIYDLTPREALFHGDEALRMHPVGGAEAIHGRTGLLTHSYLLGPNGQSNGCVSFKDYPAFLRAYKDGKVKRMVVVASVDDPQVDLRLLGRSPVVAASQNFPSRVRTSWSFFSRPEDDRYLPDVSASRASRTN